MRDIFIKLKQFFQPYSHFILGSIAGVLVLIAIFFVVFIVPIIWNARPTSNSSITPEGAPDFIPTPDTASRDAFLPEDSTNGTNVMSPDTRLIIQTGRLSILVKDVPQSNQDIQSLAQNLDGYVTDSQTTILSPATNSTVETLQSTITIRIPADRFSEAMTHIKSIAASVRSESVTGQDVTEQFTDLQAQLRNLHRAEEQLLELFDRSGSVEEILRVQQEITKVRGQIEQIEGRVQYLQDRTDFSSITVTLAPEREDVLLIEESWTPVTAVRKAIRDLISFSQRFADTLLYAAIFYGPFVLLGVLIWQWYRRRK